MALTDKLTAIAEGFRTSRGIHDALTLDEMAVLSAEPLGAAENLPHAEIPDYVKQEAMAVARRVQAVCDDDSIVFLAMSDLHHCGQQVDSWQTNINAGNLHAVQAAKILAYVLKFDFMCHLGDVTLGSGTTTRELLLEQIGQVNSWLEEAFRGVPQLRTVGNHDTNMYRVRETGDLSEFTGSQTLMDLIGSHCDGAVYGSLEYGYCYRDFEDRKLRVICLNTSEGETYFEGDYSDYIVSPTQRLWFAQTLQGVGSKSDAAQWSIVVLSHYPIDYGGTHPVSSIVRAYTEGDSVTEDGTTISFNGKNRAKFVANFHGHTHCFNYGKLSTIANGTGTEYDAWRIAVPNACFYRENSYAGQTSNGIDFSEETSYPKTASTGKDTAFVVNVINPSQQMIHSICYGAGYDRTISYAAATYWSITKNLIGASLSGADSYVEDGKPYSAAVLADAGYFLPAGAVTVTMDGTDITATAYLDGMITISAVTGNVEITVRASKEGSYVNQIRRATSAQNGSDIYGEDYNGDGTPDGYKTGTRINSSNTVSSVTGMCVTGFIPVKAGDVVRVKNVTLSGSATPYLLTYTGTSAYLSSLGIGTLGTPDGDGVYTWVVTNQGSTKVAAFRLSVGVIDDTSIITINEVIQ